MIVPFAVLAEYVDTPLTFDLLDDEVNRVFEEIVAVERTPVDFGLATSFASPVFLHEVLVKADQACTVEVGVIVVDGETETFVTLYPLTFASGEPLGAQIKLPDAIRLPLGSTVQLALRVSAGAEVDVNVSGHLHIENRSEL